MAGLETYSDWLKAKRREQKLTQEKLAEESGLGRTYINAIENGRIKLPQFATRAKIHSVLGSSDDELVDLELLAQDQNGNEWVPERTPTQEPIAQREERISTYIPGLHRVQGSPYGVLAAALVYAFRAMTEEQRAEILKLLNDLDDKLKFEFDNVPS